MLLLTLGLGDGMAMANFYPPKDSLALSKANYTSNRDSQIPINVIYFVPSELKAKYLQNKNTIEQNISEALLYVQSWYKMEMNLAGYPDKTFALATNKKQDRVMIVPIFGTKTSAAYKGNGDVKSEVEAYLAENPNLNWGVHGIVITDNETNFRVAANGRVAFARSTDGYQMIKKDETLGGLQLMWCGTCGGLIHEFAHALNAPHIALGAAGAPNKSIMGGGGAIQYNSGKNLSKLILAPSTAAILNNSQALNRTDNGIKYYEVKPTIVIKSFSIQKNNLNKATLAKFRFTSDIKPTNLYVAYDALPDKVNDDYDRVSYTTTITKDPKNGDYIAELEIPYVDFFNGFNDENKKTISLSVDILTENGFRIEPIKYQYTITNAPEPDDNINRATP